MGKGFDFEASRSEAPIGDAKGFERSEELEGGFPFPIVSPLYLPLETRGNVLWRNVKGECPTLFTRYHATAIDRRCGLFSVRRVSRAGESWTRCEAVVTGNVCLVVW